MIGSNKYLFSLSRLVLLFLNLTRVSLLWNDHAALVLHDGLNLNIWDDDDFFLFFLC